MKQGDKTCREKAIYLELLVDAILESWKPLDGGIDNITLEKVNKTQGYSEAGFRYYY